MNGTGKKMQEEAHRSRCAGVAWGWGTLVALVAICLGSAFPALAQGGDSTSVKIAVPCFRTAGSISSNYQSQSKSGAEVSAGGETFAAFLESEVKMQVPGTTVVARDVVDQAIKEMKLDDTALFEGGGASRLGRLLQADYVVAGTINSVSVGRSNQFLGGQELAIGISVRVLDVVTGATMTTQTVTGRAAMTSGADLTKISNSSDVSKVLIGSGSSTRKNTDIPADLLSTAAKNTISRVINEIVECIRPDCKVQGILDGGSVVVDKGQAQGVAVGDKFSIYTMGKKVGDYVQRDLVAVGQVGDVQAKASMLRLDRPLPVGVDVAKLMALRIRSSVSAKDEIAPVATGTVDSAANGK